MELILRSRKSRGLASKKNGGLGVSSFHALNRALLLKWVWRFISQDGSLWFRVIQALYEPYIVSHPVNLSSNWFSIVRELHLLTDKGFYFLSGDKSFQDLFPRLFALELDKEVLVADKMKAVVGHSFRRPVRAGSEHQQMVDLNSLMESVSLPQSHDRWFCDLTVESEDPKFPTGFTSDVVEENVAEKTSDQLSQIKKKNLDEPSQPKNGISDVNDGFPTDKKGSHYFPKFKAGLGSKAKKDWIQELNKKYKVNFVAIQETKSKNMNLFSIKALWGNLSFDYLLSPAVSYSGGILCAWDLTMFAKDSSTVCDSFVAVRRMLWDYFSHLIDSWDGECVLMGDFNEVRFEHERHGTVFNFQGANAFNSFITMAGLIDLPLECYSFTWSHKSASKMSKLDRYLNSKGLLVLFPSMLALCLDRHLSDHRPILMRDLKVDYGPTPFRFFHSWFGKKGFDDLALKSAIKQWVIKDKQKSFATKLSIQKCLSDLDKKIDEGHCDEETVNESDVQSAFVLNHQILEGLFILNEFLSWCKYKKIKAMIFKADFEKAFDLGDPLSPFLFILFMESLHISFNNVMSAGLFKGIRMDDSLTLSHLFYADDVVFVRKWDILNLSIIVNVLKWFFLASGLKINLHKSKLMGIGVPNGVVVSAARFIGCSTLYTPFSYFGVKVGGYMSRINSWEDVIAKLASRLSKWKLKTLSIGGHLTLIKSVLSSLPFFHMPIFKVPKCILNKMEVIRRKFFNGVENSDMRVCVDKLPTRLNLTLCSIDISSILGPLCSIVVESTSHLLFSCHLARQLMCKVGCWWDLVVPDLNSYSVCFGWFNNIRLSKRIKDILEEVSGWVHDFVKDEEEDSDSEDGSIEEGPYSKNVDKQEEVNSEEGDVEEVSKTIFKKEQDQVPKEDNFKIGENGCNYEDPFNIYGVGKKGDETLKNDQEENKILKLFRRYSLCVGSENGEVGIMGDFNEVRTPAERYGSIFNVQGANAFNSFISSTGLEEVPSGGCSFTWCHKSANKMSKLDRFLISEGLMSSCPNITATTLDRYLFDYRPILLREYHKRFKLGKIKKENSYIQTKNLKADLAEIDLLLDKGEADYDILKKRVYVSKSLHDIEKLESTEVAQKAKIKWAIEGDENSKYYHGILNKKRSQLAVCGILVNGTWIDSPYLMKNKFLSHFKFRFDQPGVSRLHLNNEFHNKLTMDQKIDLECAITRDEIKRAVWDCEIDKSPGPDRFYLVDFEKAYDSVRWDYLDDVLKNFGFGDKWRRWIQNCLKSLKGSAIVNGSSTKEFSFVESDSNIKTIVHVLECFHRASGLRINMNKSKIMRISVAKSIVEHATTKIGCAILTILFSYLGSKVGDLMGGIEQEQLLHLMARLSGTTLVDMQDMWSWSLDGTGEFSVASVRKLCRVSHLRPDG
uniref:RNA-directed DNA polymerase, eukaryota n=1 Tax=Tanacetum cinerariifolium TaxID=118510 RepID=A0A6L2P677_TANCI|nr:RNA-directed DNA polymerase, eukaryota [Tanacetum cinerariifolium]